jgi:hypothetical protein
MYVEAHQLTVGRAVQKQLRGNVLVEIKQGDLLFALFR